MKTTIFSMLLIALCTICKAQGYVIRLDLKNTNDNKVLLAYAKDNRYVLDTGIVVSGNTLVFKGQIEQPTIASLFVQNPKQEVETAEGFIPAPDLLFFLTNNQINIKGDANKIHLASVRGGKPNKEWNSIKPQIATLTDENWEALKNAYALATKKDSTGFKKLDALKETNALKSSKLEMDFINKNPQSLVSMLLLSTKVNELGLGEMENAFDKLDSSIKQNIWAKMISEKIDRLKATAIEQNAKDFSKKDKNGTTISLSSLKGKYVLLDFWGSWCAPCRKNNPHLKKLYQAYKDQGFEILGIRT